MILVSGLLVLITALGLYALLQKIKLRKQMQFKAQNQNGNNETENLANQYLALSQQRNAYIQHVRQNMQDIYDAMQRVRMAQRSLLPSYSPSAHFLKYYKTDNAINHCIDRPKR